MAPSDGPNLPSPLPLPEPAPPPGAAVPGTLPRASTWEQVQPILQDIAPLVSLVVLLIFFSLAADGFLRLTTITHVLQQGSILAIVAVGLTFVLLCGEIDLSVGTMATAVACTTGYLFDKAIKWEWTSPWCVLLIVSVVVIVVPLLVGVALGLVSGSLTIASRLPSFIITLAMMNIAAGCAQYLSQGARFTELPAAVDTVGGRGVKVIERQRTVPARNPQQKSFTVPDPLEIPYNAMLAGAVMATGYVVLQHTRFGRYVYMTGGNREAARLAGVRTGLIVCACLAISAFCAGLGGLVSAGRLSSTGPDENKTLLLDAVACVVLGGTSLFGGEGGIRRTLVGVLTYTVLFVGLNKITWINDHARALLMGLVLLAALVVNGLLARKRR